MTSILIGLLTIGLGSWGLYHWWGDVAIVLKGLAPLSLICGGLVTLIAGIASLRK